MRHLHVYIHGDLCMPWLLPLSVNFPFSPGGERRCKKITKMSEAAKRVVRAANVATLSWTASVYLFCGVPAIDKNDIGAQSLGVPLETLCSSCVKSVRCHLRR